MEGAPVGSSAAPKMRAPLGIRRASLTCVASNPARLLPATDRMMKTPSPAMRSLVAIHSSRPLVGCVVALGACLSLAACGEPEGIVLLGIEGTESLAQGWPRDGEDGEVTFADGWRLSFTHYIVSVERVELGAEGDDPIATSDSFVVDLRRQPEALQIMEGVPEGTWDRFAVRLFPATAVAVAPRVDPDDLNAMVTNAWSHSIRGTATDPAEQVAVEFDFSLSAGTLIPSCENGEGGSGLTVKNKEFTTATITVNPDDMFRTSLEDGTAPLRFGPIAGARGDDFVVTWDELANQPLDNLVDVNGDPLVDEQGDPIVYDVAGTGVTDLRGYMLEALRRQIFLNGSGRCAPGLADDGAE